MAKEAYYFSHDSNARHDPKITAMRSVYGSEGYGWFWMLIEMMREADGYKLDMQGKYSLNAYAKQMDTECKALEQYVNDCIKEFELFDSDGCYFWSPSLNRRMAKREEVVEKRRAAANAKWEKARNSEELKDDDANALHMQSKSNANGMQGKERKGNIKDLYIAQFDMFWDIYPNKKGKSAALKKWLTYGDSIDIEKVLSGTRDYIEFCKATDRPYKDGSTFVNQKSWEDEWVQSGPSKVVTFGRTAIQTPEVQLTDEERERLALARKGQIERNKSSFAINH